MGPVMSGSMPPGRLTRRDDRLGVAVVGYGPWGANHARAVGRSAKLRLAAVVEPREARQAVAASSTGAAIYATLDEAVQDPAVEAAVIATPAGTHVELATAALTAGRHVLVEKPVATRPVEARSLADLADHHGLQILAGHTFLYSQPIRDIKRWMATVPDRPWLVRSERLGGRRRPDCDVIWNLAPHDLSIMLYLVDEPVTEVMAHGTAFGGATGWDAATIHLRFRSGLAGEVYVNWRHPGAKRSLRILGEDWALRYRYDRAGDVLSVDGADRTDTSLLARSCGRTPDGRLSAYPEPLLEELEAFAHACRTGTSAETGPAHFIPVIEVLDAASRSASVGGVPIALEPNNETPLPVAA
jgi:predicted dehydrogenase